MLALQPLATLALPVPTTASTAAAWRAAPGTAPANDPAAPTDRSLYDALWAQPEDPQVLADSRGWLDARLADASALDCALPAAIADLPQWMLHNTAAVGARYQDYLAERKAGAPRRFFGNRAHALAFLRGVAPTKMTDGAWLYGVLRHWQNPRYADLVRTYLEELGDGRADRNHVLLFRQLLATHGLEQWHDLPDDHYTQGALQLALAAHTDDLLPEVIGFNLGYEQLPLHLPITAYELNELGIDPYYFTLHVTIDNAGSGHACKAAQSVLSLLPLGEGRDEFYRRVAQGYRLNDLGAGTTAVIEGFNLQDEVVAMLERKRSFGQHMHSDYCRFEGKTVNQWLAKPGQIGDFLTALQDKGWIERDHDPAESRFWQLIEGAGAAMFGAFSGYEKQVLHDWIAGSWVNPQRVTPVRPGRGSRLSREQHRPADPDTQALVESLWQLPDEQQINTLIPWMSARRHCLPVGLYATRRFIQLRARLR